MFFDREPSDENGESNGFDGGLLAQLAAGGLFDMTNSGLVAEGDSGAAVLQDSGVLGVQPL